MPELSRVTLFGASARAVPVLEQWLRFSPGLLNLFGPEGLGKRSVIQALGSDNVRMIRFEGSVQPDALLGAVARQMGIAPGEAAASILAIRTQAAQVREANYLMLVVVERAEALPESSLALLSRLAEAVEQGPGLAVVLLSETPLKEKIQPLLSPAVTLQEVALVPLSAEETREMADDLLAQGPWSGDAVAALDPAKLFEVTDGNPGRIKRALERHCAGLPLTGRVPGRRRVASVFAGAVILALGLSAALVWQWYRPAPAPLEVASSAQTLAALEQEIANVPQAPSSLESEQPGEVDWSALPPAVEPPPLPRDLEVNLPPVPDIALPTLADLAEPAPVLAAPETSQVQADASAEEAQSEPQWAFDEAEILSSSSESYTLQVFGTRDSEAARALKSGRYADLGLRIVQVKLDEAPWFIGLLGQFDRRSEAEALARDPRIDKGFWLRSIGSVQNQIREAVQ